jgi:hypothetical protein
LLTGERVVETLLQKGFRWDGSLQRYLRTRSEGDALVRVPIRFLSIGDDLAVWAAPVELFCEIGMSVRARSPFPFTFYFGYCNGWLGYLPTRKAFAEGGYEVKTSPMTEQAETDITEGALAALHSLRR